jgi:glycosyltransferase involved in cell wall biosynthesis
MELTIVIPVYNREKYLGRTVKSIYDSGVEVKSLFLVDNNSTDGSLALCKNLAEEHSDIEVFIAEKQGAAVARNVGLDKCETEWVYFFDSDDIFTGLPKVDNEADYDVVCFPTRMVTEEGKETVRWFPKNARIENQILGAFLSTVSGIYRTAWLREKGLRWNEELIIWDDWEFGARVLMNYPRILLLPKAVCHRILLHDDSITGSSYAHNVAGKFRAIEQVDKYIDDIMGERQKEICKKQGIDFSTDSEESKEKVVLEALTKDIYATLYSLFLQCDITAGHVMYETKSLLPKYKELKGCYPIKDTLFYRVFNVDGDKLKTIGTFLKKITGMGMRGSYRLAIAIVRILRESITENGNKEEK